MATEPKTLYDGFSVVPDGMDGATPPSWATMAYRTSYAINVSHRGGYAKPRPGWTKRPFRADGVVGESADYIQNGLFQGAGVYYPDNGAPQLIFGCSGFTYALPIDTWQVRNITPPSGQGNSTVSNWWFCQAENYFLRNTGIDPLLIYDGNVTRPPNANEIGAGGPLCYAWGRVWYATTKRDGYKAGDLVWGNGNRSDVLLATENQFLGDGPFALPGNVGKITSIKVPGQMENGLGQGPVHIFCERGVFTNNAPVDRDEWFNLQYPIQTVSLIDNGAQADLSTVTVNGDIFFRGVDGINSYILARRDFQQWGNRNISREIQPFLILDDKNLLSHGSGVFWKNRLLITVGPKEQLNNNNEKKGIYHQGIVSLDFDVLSTMKGNAPPAWDGLWTGARVLKLLVITYGGDIRCFAFVKAYSEPDDAWLNEVWELEDTKQHDLDDTRIEWMVSPKQMEFGSPLSLKKLTTGEVFVDELSGEVDFDVNFKTDDNPVEADWANWSECATVKTCETGCVVPETLHKQYRTRMRLPMPPETCVEATGRPVNTGYKFQPVIRVTGEARIKLMRLETIVTPDTQDPKCGDQPCKTLAGCNANPLEYEIL